MSTSALWITDFGLARIETDPTFSATGEVLGTLRYMSPEQALRQARRRRSSERRLFAGRHAVRTLDTDPRFRRCPGSCCTGQDCLGRPAISKAAQSLDRHRSRDDRAQGDVEGARGALSNRRGICGRPGATFASVEKSRHNGGVWRTAWPGGCGVTLRDWRLWRRW